MIHHTEGPVPFPLQWSNKLHCSSWTKTALTGAHSPLLEMKIWWWSGLARAFTTLAKVLISLHMQRKTGQTWCTTWLDTGKKSRLLEQPQSRMTAPHSDPPRTNLQPWWRKAAAQPLSKPCRPSSYPQRHLTDTSHLSLSQSLSCVPARAGHHTSSQPLCLCARMSSARHRHWRPPP